MMCSTDEQQRQESGWNGASVLQEAPNLRDLLSTLDRARHDSLRENATGCLLTRPGIAVNRLSRDGRFNLLTTQTVARHRLSRRLSRQRTHCQTGKRHAKLGA
jgi:hypothetical protein